jgi:hypothetical protein
MFGIAFLVLLGVSPLSSAVKQVRVTADRASLYIEPSRTSSRIEIVTKGTVLNLLQERKVKDIWYYVSFVSPRYGSRISGFILETMVEPVEGSPPPAIPKPEELVPPKKEAEPAPPAEHAAPPKADEKIEALKEIPAPPRTMESLAFTALPRNRTFNFPRKETPLQAEASPPATQPVISQKPEVKVETQPKPPEAEKPPPEQNPEAKPPEAKAPEPEKKPAPEPTQQQPVKISRVSPPRKGPGFITLGLGYGSSFGGAGGSFQWNTRMGLSLHAGIGLYPTSLVYSETDWVKNQMMWSVGLKYYLPFSSAAFFPFVDLQYGGVRVEAAQVVIGVWDYQYVLSQEQKSLWGPSFLGGIELRKGRLGITAALGAAYATTSWKYLQNKVSLVFDAGLVLHF